jgi:hypothetical protein
MADSAAIGGNGTGVSPGKWSGRKSKSQVKQFKGNAAVGWYLRSWLLQGGIEVILITTSSMKEDAFYNPILVALNALNPTGAITTIGLIGAFYMRVSVGNTARLMNYRKGVVGEYQRRAFVRVIDEGEESADHRLAALRVIKSFLEEPANNKFSTKVYIAQPGWDMSTGQHLRTLDNFLEYKEIVKIIMVLFDGVDGGWAVNNMESAMYFFTAGHIPFAAHEELGFSVEDVMVRSYTEEKQVIVLPAVVSPAEAMVPVIFLEVANAPDAIAEAEAAAFPHENENAGEAKNKRKRNKVVV